MNLKLPQYNVGNVKMPGASLIEAVVASMVFLIVFLMSLETITRISAVDMDTASDYTMIEADCMADICFARYSEGYFPPGIYTDNFSWGNIVTEIKAYGEYGGLMEVTVKTEMAKGLKNIIRIHIIEVTHE